MTDGYSSLAAADLSLSVFLSLGTHEITDSTKLEHTQRKYMGLATVDFFQNIQYYYHNLIKKLNLQKLLIRHHHSDVFFIMIIIVLNVAFLS